MFRALVLTPQRKDLLSRQRRRWVVEALGDFKVDLLNPIPGRPPGKSKTFYPSLFPGMSFGEETALLNKADFVIADLSGADFKTGFLISESLRQDLPVFGLFWEQIEDRKAEEWSDSALMYTECVNKDNIRSVLRRFLRHVRRLRHRRGKLIVFDGTDGSGKATQIDLLTKYLERQKLSFRSIDFPRYEASFFGEMVGRFLNGEYGSFNTTDPHLAAVLYAADRALARDQLYDWLRAGNIVIANRYTSANLGHQAARLPEAKRAAFIDWVQEMEYRVNRLPREDLVIFFHVPARISQKLVGKKAVRSYLKGNKRDEAKRRFDHQLESEKVFLTLAKRFRHWKKIECVDAKGHLLPPEVIHHRVVNLLRRQKILEK